MMIKGGQLCCLSTMLCTVISSSANIKTSSFQKVKVPQTVRQNSVISVTAWSLADCSQKCLSQRCACFSFDKQTRLCTIGTCLKNNSGLASGKDFYISCEASDGFQLLTHGSVTACLWESDFVVNYFNARDDCIARDAYLYTVKNVDKLSLLKANYHKSLWLGLNDLDAEGVYRWVDDSVECDTDCRLSIFKSGEPNDGGGIEDCAVFDGNNQDINDYICDAITYFICEKPFYNFP